VAYAEITEDEADKDVEIGHLIVAPNRIAAGVGLEMLVKLTERLKDAYPYDEVWASVNPRDDDATEFLASAGFEEAAEVSGPNALWMKKKL
jgi:ribosomal protein S18 acetylase RimI-like enzyme